MLPLRDNVPTRRFPVVTVALIAVNVLVWVLYQLPDLNGSVDELAFHPCEVEDSCPTVGQDWPLTALTSMFMHGSWAHLLGNMLFLWIFGNNVEDALGHVRYLLFYLAGGIVATAAQTFVTLAWGSEQDGTIPHVGASGAVSAVLGAYLLLLPHAKVLTLIFFVIREVPAIVVPRDLVLVPADRRQRRARPSPRGRRRRLLRPHRRLLLRLPAREARAAAPPARSEPLTMTTFEEHVRAALDALPPKLAAALDNVAVVIEEENADEPDLYGLFDWPEYMPAKISIYRRPLLEDFDDPDELEEEIKVTVLHELAHYFGMDEDQIAGLGYD